MLDILKKCTIKTECPANTIAYCSHGIQNKIFSGGSSYSTSRNGSLTSSEKYFPLNIYRTFDMGDPNIILGKLKEFNGKVNTTVNEESLEEIVQLCSKGVSNSKILDDLFQLLNWPDGMVFLSTIKLNGVILLF